MAELDDVTGTVIDSALGIHRDLGPGLLESVYERVLAADLERRGLSVQRQFPVTFTYRGLILVDAFRVDLLINNAVLTPMQRRDFVATTGSCAAHLALAALLPPAVTRGWIRPYGRVVAREPFGTLEQVAEGIWALISTPLEGDRTTLSNGGLIAGTDGVLAIEGFFTRDGAAWLAERSVELTGRRPTHVALTHYHADHVNGVLGYMADGRRPAVQATADTSDRASLSDIALLAPDADTTLDLGGRRVTLSPRAGHTASDVTLTVEDPRVVFCGDLVWNGMFPNYVDTTPSLLTSTVRALRSPETTFVPGHGPLAALADVDRYLAMLDAVEEAARRGHSAGMEAEVAAAAFVMPDAVGEWILFGRTFLPRAFGAWYRELAGA